MVTRGYNPSQPAGETKKLSHTSGIQRYRLFIKFIVPLPRMKRFIYTTLLAALTVCCDLSAQTEQADSIPANRYRTHATLLGIGGTNLLDTYLTPLEYTGTEVRILRETERMTRMAKGRISVQSRVDGHVAYAKSPTDDNKEWEGYVSWNMLWHYNWRPLPGLTLQAGGGSEIGGGFLYNTHQGNNPAQARAAIHLKASVAARYRFRLWGHPLTARYQVDAPLMGAMFSPNYGQSYYELFSLGHYDHNVCFTHPGNAPGMTHLLTLDIPIGNAALRTGYLCDIRQSHVNHLKAHSWSHLFVIGYVKHFYLVKPNRRTP